MIAAVPAPALLRIRGPEELIPAKLREALSGLRYESLAKTVVHCRRRIWEINQDIAGGGSFTDTPIQQCWYPSDNAREMSALEAEQLELSQTPLYSWTGSRGFGPYVVPTSWVPANRNISEGPGSFVGAYMWGANAQRFSALTDHERDTTVVEALRQLHPGIEREIIDIEHLCWDEGLNPGGGSVAFFRPGEAGRYQQTLSEATSKATRLFFAGEHLGVLHAWIQTSLLTAWAAVARILQRP